MEPFSPEDPVLTTYSMQVTAIVVLYGPRTTALVACDDGVYEFTCGKENKWFASKERIQINKESKIFSPANMRAAQVCVCVCERERECVCV